MHALIAGLVGLSLAASLVGCAGAVQPERARQEEARERMKHMQEMLRVMREQCAERRTADPAVDCSEYDGPAVDVRPGSLGTP